MWEVRDSISGPADFTCGKCSHLQLLTDRVRVDEIKIIWEAERAIERSYRVIVTHKNEGSWVSVRGRKGKKQSVHGSPVVIPFNNKYTVLDTVGGGGGGNLPGVSHGDRVFVTESGSVPQKRRGGGIEDQ